MKRQYYYHHHNPYNSNISNNNCTGSKSPSAMLPEKKKMKTQYHQHWDNDDDFVLWSTKKLISNMAAVAKAVNSRNINTDESPFTPTSFFSLASGGKVFYDARRQSEKIHDGVADVDEREEDDDNDDTMIYSSSTEMEIFFITHRSNNSSSHTDDDDDNIFQWTYINRNILKMLSSSSCFDWETIECSNMHIHRVKITRKSSSSALPPSSDNGMLLLSVSSTTLYDIANMRILINVNDVLTEIRHNSNNNIIGAIMKSSKIHHSVNTFFFIPVTHKTTTTTSQFKDLYKELTVRLENDFMKYHLLKIKTTATSIVASSIRDAEAVVVMFDDKVYKSPYALANRLYKFVDILYYGEYNWQLCLRWRFYEREKDILDPFFLSLSQMHEGWIREVIRHFVRKTIPDSPACQRKYHCMLTRLLTTPPRVLANMIVINDEAEVDNITTIVINQRCSILSEGIEFMKMKPNYDYLVYKICEKGHGFAFENLRDLLSHEDDVYELLPTITKCADLRICPYQPLLGYLDDTTTMACLLLPKYNNNQEIGKSIIRHIDDTLKIMYYGSSRKDTMLRRNVLLLKLGYATLKWAVAEQVGATITEMTNAELNTTNSSSSSSSNNKQIIKCMIAYLLKSCEMGDNPNNIEWEVAQNLFFIGSNVETLKYIASENLAYKIEGEVANKSMICILKMCIILNLLKFIDTTTTTINNNILLPFKTIVSHFCQFGRYLKLPYNDTYCDKDKRCFIMSSILGYPCQERELEWPTPKPKNFDHFDQILPFIEYNFENLMLKRSSSSNNKFSCICCKY